jgi:lysophospholipase L1-like esterase
MLHSSMDLYCFGDSITYGECDTERGGWVDRIKTECMARFVAQGGPDVSVFNLGIGGETSKMMRSRLKTELKTRLDASARSLVTLAYGANDAAESGGSLLVPREEYVANLSWAIDEARQLGCEVWLLNLAPVAPAADGLRNRSGRLRSNAVVSRYNDALRDLSQATSAGLIDVNGAFKKHGLASLFVADGVHPNAEGHALICNLVRDVLLADRRA